MQIEMIQRNARIPIESLVDDIRAQWLDQGAIVKTDTLKVGFAYEEGQWYINIIVKPMPPINLVKQSFKK